MVYENSNILGIGGAIITHPKVWEASGHASQFVDYLVKCKKCGQNFRADHLIEDILKKNVKPDKKEIEEIIRENNLRCPKCKGELGEVKEFNLMFKIKVGPEGGQISYLRPETAQLIYINFKNILDTGRQKIPFGIAQIGKAFRNEISPRDFLFRMREFEQMEIEYFVHPDKINECPYLTKEILDYKLNVYSAEMQKCNKEMERMRVEDALKKGIITTAWHAYWLAVFYRWLVELGLNPERLRIRQHLPEERSHYARDTWDIEYLFPFGWKEIHGMSNRSDYDLKQHMKFSGKDLSYFDDEERKKVIPHVIEPSQGVDRLFLALLIDAYTQEEDRVVLKLHPKLAPYKVGVFPLVSRDGLDEIAKGVYERLKNEFTCFYDEKGSIGRRYARQDEIGTPFCVTVDYQTKEDNTVTIRDRDTKQQIRVKIERLEEVLRKLIRREITLKELG